MVGIIKSILALLTSIAVSLSSFAFGDFTGAFAPNNTDECIMTFAAISDTHIYNSIDGGSLQLRMGLDDMQKAKRRPDALVIAGDITNNAKLDQWELLYDAFDSYTPANEEIILALGNHDTWNKEVDENNRYPESIRLFYEYSKKISNRELTKPYFTTEVKGYSFIVLGSEADTTKTTISDEQLLWLDAELFKASLKGLPIFVVSHAALDNTHGLPNTWFGDPLNMSAEELSEHDGSFADGKSDQIKSILDKYKNVILISGHIHNGLANNFETDEYSFSTVETYGNITSVNLPTYGSPTLRGCASSGCGIVFEVYENELILRGRCFSGDVWYTEYVYNIPLV